MGIENGINCSFCRRERDYTLSITFFLEMCVRKSFWEQFQTTLNTGSSNARTVTLNENFVLFGHDSQIKSDSTSDLIILRAKFYIYTCKINKNIPQLHLFKHYLKNTFDLDKYNAILTMSYDKIANECLYYKKLIKI